jgi:hypothetical protein
LVSQQSKSRYSVNRQITRLPVPPPRGFRPMLANATELGVLGWLKG